MSLKKSAPLTCPAVKHDTNKLLNARLGWYGMAAGAALLGTTSATGAVVSNDLDVTFSRDFTDIGAQLNPVDINNDGVDDITVRLNNLPQFGFIIKEFRAAVGVLKDTAIYGSGSNPTPYAQVLGIGDQVGPGLGQTFQAEATLDALNTNNGNGYFPTGRGIPSLTDGLIGFAFEIGTETHYGYVEMTYVDSNLPGETTNTISLGTAFWEDTPDTAIAVPIPEPASLALLAAGAAGLMSYRQRRDAA